MAILSSSRLVADVRRQLRPGFALVPVLWVLVSGASLAFAVSTVGRDAIGATRNRETLERATWVARGCVAVIREAAEQALWRDGFTAASVIRQRGTRSMERSTRRRWLRADAWFRSCPVAID